MTDLLLHFLPLTIGGFLTYLSYRYDNALQAVFGGSLLLLWGTNAFINPLPVISTFLNFVTASVVLGYGAYLFIAGGIGLIKENEAKV